MPCRGRCELQLTRIITNPIQPTVDTAPPGVNGPLAMWAHKADMEAAQAAVVAKVNAFAQPVYTVGCQQPPMGVGPGGVPVPPIPCVCRQTEKADWTDCETLKDVFGHKFQSRGRAWEARVEVEYQVVFVDGVCREPQGVVRYAANIGIIEGHGLVVASAGGEELSAETLAKIKGALG